MRGTVHPQQDDGGNGELPAIPAHWCWSTVGQAGEVKLGRQRSPEHHDGPHMRPYLRVANVFEARIDLSDVLQMNFTPAEYETYKLQYGDILLNEGQSLELVGRPAMYRDDLPGGCFQNTLIRFRPHQNVDSRFALLVFRHYLHSQRFQHVAKWTVNIAHLGAQRLAGIEFPIPPLNEQRRIAAKAEELFSDLDAGVAALERVRANLKRYRAAVLKAAVEGRLTEQWRASHPDVEPASRLLQRILAERRRKWEEAQLARFAANGKPPPKNWRDKYPEPAAPDTANLPDLPKGWCWATIEQLASSLPRSIQSGPFGSSLHHSEFRDTGILAIGIDNVLDGQFSIGRNHRISPEKFEQLNKYEARPRDLLITVMATVGRCCVVPEHLETAIITKHVYRISLEQSLVDPFFVLASFCGDTPVRDQLFGGVRGQTRPGVNGQILRRISVPLPPLPEQAQVVSEIDRRLSLLTVVQSEITTSLRKSSYVRQSILKRAFEGKLVPQDPTDEPVRLLLDRMQPKAASVSNGRSDGQAMQTRRARRAQKAGGSQRR